MIHKAEVFSIIFYAICAFINAFAIMGLHKAASDKFIFESLRKAMKRALGDTITDPILGCPYCMSSVWAGAPFFVFTQINEFGLLASIVSPVVYACAVCGIIWYLKERAERNKA